MATLMSAIMLVTTMSSRRFVRAKGGWQNGNPKVPLINGLTRVGARDACDAVFYIPPILKVLPISICSLKSMGKRLQNELLASKLSERRPPTLFLGADTKNGQLHEILILQLIYGVLP